ncbi:hypothetical protein D9M70_513930 [compost metagenome]
MGARIGAQHGGAQHRLGEYQAVHVAVEPHRAAEEALVVLGVSQRGMAHMDFQRWHVRADQPAAERGPADEYGFLQRGAVGLQFGDATVLDRDTLAVYGDACLARGAVEDDLAEAPDHAHGIAQGVAGHRHVAQAAVGAGPHGGTHQQAEMCLAASLAGQCHQVAQLAHGDALDGIGELGPGQAHLPAQGVLVATLLNSDAEDVTDEGGTCTGRVHGESMCRLSPGGLGLKAGDRAHSSNAGAGSATPRGPWCRQQGNGLSDSSDKER